MKIPTIGDVLEDGSGERWRVAGVQMGEGVEVDRPERKTLYLDLDPVKDRPAIPDGIRRSLEECGLAGDPLHECGADCGAIR